MRPLDRTLTTWRGYRVTVGMKEPAGTANPSLTLVDRDSSAGPVVTPEPAPSDDLLIKMAIAAGGGALVGSFVAYRWLRRHVDLKL